VLALSSRSDVFRALDIFAGAVQRRRQLVKPRVAKIFALVVSSLYPSICAPTKERNSVGELPTTSKPIVLSKSATARLRTISRARNGIGRAQHWPRLGRMALGHRDLTAASGHLRPRGGGATLSLQRRSHRHRHPAFDSRETREVSRAWRWRTSPPSPTFQCLRQLAC
jgi:hypothetical protein